MVMKYVCDAPDGATWFRIETEGEAEAESALMRHAVDKYFKRFQQIAKDAYRPSTSLASFEREIGLKDHLARAMPIFLTLRADDGAGLATAMVPPEARGEANVRCIIVGPGNSDPYTKNAPAISALARHFGVELRREACYPYA